VGRTKNYLTHRAALFACESIVNRSVVVKPPAVMIVTIVVYGYGSFLAFLNMRAGCLKGQNKPWRKNNHSQVVIFALFRQPA
jgi:hypothetical protein